MLFVILIGSLMEILQKSGSIDAFVSYMQEKKKIVKSARSALLLSYVIGIVIFIESSITSLVAGAVGRPFCQKYSIAPAKLAFVCDSTSAPISSLLVFNGWGALLLGLISTQVESGLIHGESVSFLIDAVFYNFYAMVVLVITLIAIVFNINLGAMKYASLSHSSYKSSSLQGAALYPMLVPIVFMVGAVFFFLYFTGEGNIFKGSGSSSIFYSVISTLILMFFLYVPSQKMSIKLYIEAFFSGMKKLFFMAVVLLFAFAIGKVTNEMHTGVYLAGFVQNLLSPIYLGGVVFLLASLISFATGTSWGTFSIMIPVAVPMAVALDANVALAIGAVISGGVFGDHCSPISDTTIISSLAAECDVVEHVNTQLPYALLSAGIALIGFFIFSIS
jgi:Na+/H+ antiporter NhaC